MEPHFLAFVVGWLVWIKITCFKLRNVIWWFENPENKKRHGFCLSFGAIFNFVTGSYPPCIIWLFIQCLNTPPPRKKKINIHFTQAAHNVSLGEMTFNLLYIFFIFSINISFTWGSLYLPLGKKYNSCHVFFFLYDYYICSVGWSWKVISQERAFQDLGQAEWF